VGACRRSKANRKPLEKDVVSLGCRSVSHHLSDDVRYPGWVTNPTVAGP